MELTVVIGKPAKDVSEAEALEYVLAYVTGNDVSSSERGHWPMELIAFDPSLDVFPFPSDECFAMEFLQGIWCAGLLNV